VALEASRETILVEALVVVPEVTQETAETAGLEIVIHCPERLAQVVAVVEEKAAARVLAAVAVWGY
jgi:putative heme iron utilization protein